MVNEVQRTCVYSLVNLEVFGPGKDLSTAWIRTWKRFLSGVYSDVIDKLVLGLERLVDTFTSAPVTRVIGLFGATDVVNCQMCH